MHQYRMQREEHKQQIQHIIRQQESLLTGTGKLKPAYNHSQTTRQQHGQRLRVTPREQHKQRQLEGKQAAHRLARKMCEETDNPPARKQQPKRPSIEFISTAGTSHEPSPPEEPTPENMTPEQIIVQVMAQLTWPDDEHHATHESKAMEMMSQWKELVKGRIVEGTGHMRTAIMRVIEKVEPQPL